MRKIILYIASSLNGKIAKTDDSVDWLESIPNPNKLDYGYKALNKSIDTTIQGYSSYAQVMAWDIPFPYADKKNYVITRKQDLTNTEHVAFISQDHIEFIKRLKEQEGKNIWLIGGGQINSMLLEAGLIDEIQLFLMPVVIEGGVELFESLGIDKSIRLIESKSHPTGVVEMRYVID